MTARVFGIHRNWPRASYREWCAVAYPFWQMYRLCLVLNADCLLVSIVPNTLQYIWHDLRMVGVTRFDEIYFCLTELLD